MSSYNPLGRKLDRRDFLKLLAASAGALFLPGCLSPQNPQSVTYKSPENLIALLLEAGVKPEVHNVNGNRTLFGIGEINIFPGYVYVPFFQEVEKSFKFNRLFRERVFRPEAGFKEPRIEWERKVAEYDGDEFTQEKQTEIKTMDDEGYYALSKNHQVIGIEDEIAADDAIRATAIPLLLLHAYDLQNDFKKKPEVERRIKDLVSGMRTAKFGDIDMPETFSGEKLKPYFDRCTELVGEVAIIARNKTFVRTIDQYLKPGEVGALTIGKAHLFRQDFSPKGEGATIIPGLNERGINSILITLEQAKQYLVHHNLLKPTSRPESQPTTQISYLQFRDSFMHHNTQTPGESFI